ncbi:MAG: response regulator [Bdellovibrionaceae bacterium]|nr:response regulator [Pseudobdellovibrionaceae bacterium]
MVTNILVIDDDPGVIELLIEEIDNNFSDVRLISATSGYRAIEILQNNWDFEVIISDYIMPDGSGVDVLNYLVNKKCSISFILHTSSLNPSLPKDVGDSFLGIVEKMDFYELNMILTKLFLG